jgi:hypothetical protein
MPTINDFINHARRIDLIKPLKLLASDPEVIKKVESLSDGQVAVVIALCKLGALKVTRDTLYEAFQYGNSEIFAFLLKAGADVNERGFLGLMVNDILRNASDDGKISQDKDWDMLNLVLETRQCDQESMAFALSMVGAQDNADMHRLLMKFAEPTQPTSNLKPKW